MPGELENKELENKDVKKKNPIKKKEDLTEVFTYQPGENETLIMDKPSEPLIATVTVKKEDPTPMLKTNKELYESYIKELKKFCLTLNGEVIYDSSIDKSKVSPLAFEEDYFVLFGKKYSYNGLRVQKLNK